MPKFTSWLIGWHALLVVVVAVVLAEVAGGHRFLRRGLWIVAALTAVVGAINAWRQS